jgi:hypothetical protein
MQRSMIFCLDSPNVPMAPTGTDGSVRRSRGSQYQIKEALFMARSGAKFGPTADVRLTHISTTTNPSQLYEYVFK